MVLSFFFPRYVDSVIRGVWEEAKNLAGKCPPPDSDPFSCAERGEITPASQRNSQRLGSRIRVQRTRLAFHPFAQRNAFRRGARQQSRSFALRNQSLRHSAIPTGFLEVVSDDFPSRQYKDLRRQGWLVSQ